MRTVTLNVHGWQDAVYEQNMKRVVEAMTQLNPDIIILQEVGVRVYREDAIVPGGEYALDLFCQLLGDKMAGDWTHSGITTECYAGVAIVTRFPIKSARAIDMRRRDGAVVARTIKAGGKFRTRCMHCVLDVEGRSVRVLGVHLDHVDEPRRLSQWHAIFSVLDKEFGSYPHLIAGDFNALTRSDYDKGEWADIAEIRKGNRWEAPVTELTNIVKGITDPTVEVTLAKHSLTNKEKRRFRRQDKAKAAGLDRSTYPSYTDSWIATGRKGHRTTCRFDTRIDYIYIDREDLRAQGIRLRTCETHPNKMSDHNPVLATFDIGSSSQSSSPRTPRHDKAD